jgi:hypothetical protein
MKRNIIIVTIFSVFLCYTNVTLCDCTDLHRATSWVVQDERTIIYYAENTSVAKIVLQDCEVSSSSNVRLTKTYMCDEDNLIIDGQECALMSLTSATTGF